MRTRAHVVVSGRVQGVFFRAFVQREAVCHGVTGWVKNRGRGQVEAVFEGEKSAVNHVVDLCRTGPPHALVVQVQVRWEAYTGQYTRFSIRY